MLVLAAGQGTRLLPLTADRPKCLVELKGKPLLDWIVEHAHIAGINDIYVVTGYKANLIDSSNITKLSNERYFETNMVYTLWCAREQIEGHDVIISYGDICYKPEHLKDLIESDAEFAVADDKNWREYWCKRFERPEDDAESLKIDDYGNILEIGYPIDNIEDVVGQYIGLVKISAKATKKIFATINEIKENNIVVNGRDFDSLYMTDLLDYMVKADEIVTAVFIDRGWVEIDDPHDLSVAEGLSVVESGRINFNG